MKLYNIVCASIFFCLLAGINCNAQKKNTIIKGKVQNWPTDTIYLQTMSFHSPHSSKLIYQTISKDSTFNFEFNNVTKSFVVQLFLDKESAELNKEFLLLSNYTKNYYYGYCEKFYTYGTTTFLIEPNKILNIKLERNWATNHLTEEIAKKYKTTGIKVSKENTIETTQKTSITFLGNNIFQNEYYQKSFTLDDKIDKRLDIYKTRTIEEAVISYKKIRKKLLDKLELEKDKLSIVFYDYIKAEIEFGARKEFLKFLMFSKEKEMDNFFSKEIPKEIMEIISFDKSTINATTILNEEYNKFLMLYLNFKLNVLNKKYNRYYEYDIQKIRTAIQNFPQESVYYFVTNYLMLPQVNRKYLMNTIKNEEAVEELITKIISKYPEGELNDRLIEKYNL